MDHWEPEGIMAPAGKQLFFWARGKEIGDYLRCFLGKKEEMGMGPEDILLLSPHRESRNRFEYLLGEVFSDQGARPHVATLQGFCLELLNREGYRIGLKGRPEVIRGWQEFLILKNLLPQITPKGYATALWGKNGLVREILGFFNHLWGQGIELGELQQRLASSSPSRLWDLSLVYSKYTAFCWQEGYLPLAAIAPLAYQLLREYPFLWEGCREGRQILIATDLDQLKPIQLQIIEHLGAVFPHFLGLVFKGSSLKKELKAWKSVPVVMGEGLKQEKEIQEYSCWEKERWGVGQEILRLLVEEEYGPREIFIFLNDTLRGQSLSEVLTAMGIPCRTELVENTPLDPVLSFFLDYLRALREPEGNEGQRKWLSSPVLGLDGLQLRRAFHRASETGRKLLHVLADKGIKEPVVSFHHHLQGVRKGSISPLTIVEELYEKYNLFQRYLDELERGGGQADPKVLSNLRDFLLLARECEHFNHYFRGGRLGLDDFLQQLEGALPYLKRDTMVSVGPEEEVKIVSIRDAARYMPRAAFFPALAADIYPPQRIPTPLLGKGEWSGLGDIFPRLELPPEFDPHRFYAEHRLILEEGTAAADRVWISWAQSYPELENTGPSDLLNVNVKKGDTKDFGGEGHFTWPDPAPGVTTKARLGSFYQQQISRGKAGLPPGMRLERGQFVVNHGEPSPSPGEMGMVTRVDYFTPSALRTYLACPRRYYYQNILNLNVPPYPRAQLGLFLHRVLEDFHRYYPSLFGVKKGDAESYLEQIFARVWAEMGPTIGKGLLADFYQQEAETICRAYLARELPAWEPGRRVKVEETIDFTFGGNRLRGRLDRLDKFPGGWEIIDYKTGRDQTEGARKREFIPREGEKPVDMQPIIYYLGVRQRGICPDSITYYQLSGLIGRGKVKRSLSLGKGRGSLTSADLEEAKGILGEILGEMQRGDYPPLPRDERICNYCAFRFPCPGPGFPREGDDDE